MRIPGWLIVLFGVGSFVFITALCSVLSYSFVRTAVIDAADRGVEVPSFVELAGFIFDPPDAEAAFADLEAPISDIDSGSGAGVPFELQPTPTPDPNATQAPAPVDPEPTPRPGMTQIPLGEFVAGQGNNQPAVNVPAWQGTDRINVLLMGVDERGDEAFEDRFRTDTMILVQIDPIRKSVGVLSIPRDLWVRIPGYQSNRVNMANYLGDGDDLPGGGPALAMEVIRENFGIRVQYYVQINFDVFTTVVDTVAPQGVEICVSEEIIDPKYPDGGRGTIVIEIPAGCQMMDAERLLQYARTRATQGGDFDRNRRQQEVLDALQREVLSVGGFTSLLGSITELYNELSRSYRTNFNLEQILALAQLMATVDPDDITYGAINALHVTPDTNEEGQEILIPNYIAITQVI
ncbi:MAG: LCP family protein, partial [Phototrophicaceae bacterium]